MVGGSPEGELEVCDRGEERGAGAGGGDGGLAGKMNGENGGGEWRRRGRSQRSWVEGMAVRWSRGGGRGDARAAMAAAAWGW